MIDVLDLDPALKHDRNGIEVAHGGANRKKIDELKRKARQRLQEKMA